MATGLAACLLLILAATLAPAGLAEAQSGPAADQLLAAAMRTQAAEQARLQVLGDAFVCEEARLVSYRRSDAEPQYADQWYVASQQWADALLLGALPTDHPNAAETRCHLQKGFVFLDRLWDYQAGGYFPRSDPVGVQVEAGTRYGDDNALAGLTFLAAAATLPEDSPTRQQYVHAARREADFLLGSGLWDNTFGGGFWWNTDRGTTPEGKPAQTNALAALFFARLAGVTGDPTYRDAAVRTLLWLDTILFDPSRSLYRWSVAYQDPAHRSGAPTIATRYLNYDQGIAIEAQVAVAQLDGDPARLPRARAIGDAIQSAFWDPDQGSYVLQSGVPQLYGSYAAWTSLGHLALYDADGDPRWLEMARANLDALTTSLGETDGGIGLQRYKCVGGLAQFCAPGQTGWVVDHTRDTAAQAWFQHLQVAVAQRLAARDPTSPEAAPSGL